MAIDTIEIMGILNVTPDSFSDGGRFFSAATALEQAEKLIADGADILDIGGESTRPYAKPVPLEEELRRVIPVIEELRRHHSLPISIDTIKGEVARQALQAGANIINDISALRHDPEMLKVAQESNVPIILMHMQGTPANMQDKPIYKDVIREIIDFFRERVDWLMKNGISRDRLLIDPGIGFGKTLDHNLSILKHLEAFQILRLPLVLGHSRKRFLGEVTGIAVESARDLATATLSALCADKKIAMVRVHNVAATRQTLRLAQALRSAV